MPEHSPTTVIAETDVRPFAAFIGIDWADKEHAICLLDGHKVHHETLSHKTEAIDAWAEGLKRKFDGQPLAVMIEQSHGPLAHALLRHPHLVLFPINPKQAANYRKAMSNSGKKDDRSDAEWLARFVREHHPKLRVWQPDDEQTRELGRLVELRRKTVEIRKQIAQRVTAELKLYFPLAVELADELPQSLMRELLRRWPSLRELQRANPTTLRNCIARHLRRNEQRARELVQQIRAAKPLTTDRAIIDPSAMYVGMLVKQLVTLDESVEKFEAEIAKQFSAHPDAELFRGPPGAGVALAPRLLVAFGSDRQRFDTAFEVQCYSGIAPVTEQSGKSRHVRRRFACDKFLRQTFHEFADQAYKWCPWSKAYYQYLREKGQRHHAAVRALAFKWIRILFRCWKDRVPYDQQRYVQQLKSKAVPYAANIQTA